MKNINITALLTLVIFFSFNFGCSTRGQGISKTQICSSEHDPIFNSDEKKFSNKITLKPGESFQPSPADYLYASSEVYYYDTNQDIKIHLSHSLNADGEPSYSIVCVGGSGIHKNMKPLSFSIELVSDLRAQENTTPQVRNRIFSFVLDFTRPAGQAPLQYSSELETTEFAPGSPQDYYAEYNESEQTFATVKGTSPKYQLITNLKSTARDEKSNKELSIIVRSQTTMKTN